MPQKVTTFCDYCEKDLLEARSNRKYQLKNLETVNESPFSHSVIIPSVLVSEDKYFCNFQCLKNWINEQ